MIAVYTGIADREVICGGGCGLGDNDYSYSYIGVINNFYSKYNIH